MTELLATVLSALDRRECRMPEAIASSTGVDRRNVIRAAGTLISRGLAERAEVGCYRITEAGEAWIAEGKPFTPGPNGPLTQDYRRVRKETLFDGLWRAIRVQSTPFSVNTLLTLCYSDEPTKVVRNRASRFLSELTKRNILREMPRREPGTSMTSNGFKRWSLVNDLGPLTPQTRKNWSEVYDPNAKAVVEVRK